MAARRSSDGDIEVRRATMDDIADVVTLRIALLKEYHDHPIYGRLRHDADRRALPVFEQQLRAPDQAIFLAGRGGDVVGIIRCADTQGSPLLFPDRYCYVTSVYVKSAHRRHGVLSALMDQVERWARQRGLTEMRLHNSTVSAEARRTWDQLGFVVNEEVRLKMLGD